MADLDWTIFLIGCLRVSVWFAGAGLAWYRKRWMLMCGFGAAGCTAMVFAWSNAHGDLPATLADAASIAATPIAALIVASFVANQPKRAERPHRWSP